MNVPLYEKIWMWASGVLIVAFVTTIAVGVAGSALQPPSHVETIDPTKVWNDPRFAKRGVTGPVEGAWARRTMLYSIAWLAALMLSLVAFAR